MGCIFFYFTTRPILIMCVLTSTSTLSFSLTLGKRRLARHQRPCKHFNEQSLIFPFPIFWLPLSRSTGKGNQAVGPRSKVDSSPADRGDGAVVGGRPALAGRRRPCAEACRACEQLAPKLGGLGHHCRPNGPRPPNPSGLCAWGPYLAATCAVNWRVSDLQGLGPAPLGDGRNSRF